LVSGPVEHGFYCVCVCVRMCGRACTCIHTTHAHHPQHPHCTHCTPRVKSPSLFWTANGEPNIHNLRRDCKGDSLRRMLSVPEHPPHIRHHTGDNTRPPEEREEPQLPTQPHTLPPALPYPDPLVLPTPHHTPETATIGYHHGQTRACCHCRRRQRP
jgi:hypothetical protein